MNISNVRIEQHISLNGEPYELWFTPHGLCFACSNAGKLLDHSQEVK